MATVEPAITPTASTPAKTAAGDSLTLTTLLLYLVGNRDAILKVARCRQALWLGLLFVLSAGFAREYDGADLWHEPWRLMLPLAASLGTSLILYSLVFVAARRRGVSELKFLVGYRTLLTFYWWTAPLAWLYAIPVERFLSPGDATAANLWFLAAVSLWRVLLMTRVLSTWLTSNFFGMFAIVMFFADSVALVLTFISPQPIFNIMGGVHLSEPDDAILAAMLSVKIFGGLSWWLWLIGTCIIIGISKPPWSLATLSSSPVQRVSLSLWGVAALLLVMGVGLLPIGQPRQQRRWQAEKLLHSGEFDQAARFVSQFTRDDFPPIWDPPPRIGYGEESPQPTQVLAAIERQDAPEWLRNLYIEKLNQNSHMLWNAVPDGEHEDSAEFEHVLSVYEKYVPAQSLDGEQRDTLKNIAKDERIDAALRDRLRAYLGMAQDDSE